MSKLVFTSVLGVEHKEDLQRLLFFNANQERASEGVTYVVERYGAPKIVDDAGRLRVDLDKGTTPQTLFAIAQADGGPRAVGVVVYTREEDELIVLFVAVDGDYTSRAAKADRKVFSRMITQLKTIALRVRGIATLVVYMGRPKPTRIRIHREPATDT